MTQDPHRETLDRFINTPHDTGDYGLDSGSYWAKRWAIGRELDSAPVDDSGRLPPTREGAPGP